MRAHSPSPSDYFVRRVQAVIPATPTTRVVRVDLAGEPFPFEAGQAAFIGPATQDARIPYSIASAPLETLENGWLDFLIKVEPSGRWGHKFDSIAPGMYLGIRGPFGTFKFPTLVKERRFLFVAGGTGIAPIRAMIRQALLRGQEGRMRLLYSAKTADDFAYLPEFGEMATRPRLEGGFELHLHVTREAPDTWPGARGRITRSELAALVDDPATLCFVCGPETMVAEVPRMLTELGIAPERVRVEEW
jgi:NAD(P)H-flavin reductase